jgi:hypothetical protein
MTINIELGPDEEKVLLERARLSGRDPAQYVQKLIRDHIQAPPHEGAGHVVSAKRATTLDDLIDHEFVADCEREADDSVTLEEVRAATSKIKDSMARVIIEEERADRF